MALSSDHVNYLIWRYLQEAGHAKTAARLQREWGLSDPERLPFSQAVKSRSLVNLVSKGLSLLELEHEAATKQKPEKSKIELFFGTEDTTYPASPSPPPAPIIPPPPRSAPSRKTPAAQSPSKRVRKQFKPVASGLESENVSRTATPLRSVAAQDDYFGDTRDVDMTDADADADAEGDLDADADADGDIEVDGNSTPKTQVDRRSAAPRERTPPPAPPPPRRPTLDIGTSTDTQTYIEPPPKTEEVDVKLEQKFSLPTKDNEPAFVAWAPVQDGKSDASSQTDSSRSRRILALASGSKCQLYSFPSPPTTPGDTIDSASQPEKGVPTTIFIPQECSIESLAWSPEGSTLAIASCEPRKVIPPAEPQNDAQGQAQPEPRTCVISLIEADGTREYDVPVVLDIVYKTTWSLDSQRLLIVGHSVLGQALNHPKMTPAKDMKSVFCVLDVSKRKTYQVTNYDASIRDANWLDETRYLAVGDGAVVMGDISAEGGLKVVQAEDSATLKKFRWTKSFVDPLHLSSDATTSTRRRAVLCSQTSGALAILNLDLNDAANASIMVREKAHEGDISAIEMATPKTSTGSQTILFTASQDGNVKIWSLPSSSNPELQSLTLLRRFTTQTPISTTFQPLALSFSQRTNSLAVAALSDVLLFDIDLSAEDLGLQTREGPDGKEESIPARSWKLSLPLEDDATKDETKPVVKSENEDVITTTDADAMDVDAPAPQLSAETPSEPIEPETRTQAQPEPQQVRHSSTAPQPVQDVSATTSQLLRDGPYAIGLHHHLAWDAAGRQLAFGSVGGSVRVVELET